MYDRVVTALTSLKVRLALAIAGRSAMPTFRGRPACDCLVAWLPVFEAELQRRKVITGPLNIAQLIGNAPASAGVHSTGGAWDVWEHSPDVQLVGREMGAATWNRLWDDNLHTHGVLKGCPHNGPARYQIDALADGFDGTGSGGRGHPDTGPGPRNLRSWRQGIRWAKEQEDDMPYTEAQLAAIVQKALAAELDKPADTSKGKRSVRQQIKELFQRPANGD